jgi:uncharacterized protein YbjT (DUF2867 family)
MAAVDAESVTVTRPDPVLVTGGTGTHGGAVAAELLAAGHRVHALVRDPASDRARQLEAGGATLVRGDLDDASWLARAFAEVTVVYAVTTPFSGGVAEEERQGFNIIAAAEQAHLSWLVLASVAAAERAPVPHFASKARIEQRLRTGNVPWTVVAPSYFYENVLGVVDATGKRTLPLALPPDKPLHQVALTNLGALVAAVLGRRDEHLSKRIEVAGDAPTPAQMADDLGAELVRVPLEEVRERSADMAAMYTFLSNEGYGIDVQALRDRYPEVEWLSFADWAHDLLRRPSAP